MKSSFVVVALLAACLGVLAGLTPLATDHALERAPVVGCAQVKTTVPLAEPAFQCVVGQLLVGNDDPLSITELCIGTVVQDVADVVQALMAAAADAGIPDSSAAVAGMQRLAMIHTRALGLIGVVATPPIGFPVADAGATQ